MASIVSFIISTDASYSSCDKNGSKWFVSEYDPIPPVIGPLFPSNACGWSCAAGIATKCSPSTNACIVYSSPTSNSSITTPSNPPIFCSKISLTYSFASSLSSSWSPTILTPFPPVNPIGFTTTGSSNESMNLNASSIS